MTPTTSGEAPRCADGKVGGATRFTFVFPYVEQENLYEGDVAAGVLREKHLFRSWTDLRIIAFRNVTESAEPGIEVVTVDATNGTATWRLQVTYETQRSCVDDRAADDERRCARWSAIADTFRARLDEAGGWSAVGSSPCDASGGG